MASEQALRAPVWARRAADLVQRFLLRRLERLSQSHRDSTRVPAERAVPLRRRLASVGSRCFPSPATGAGDTLSSNDRPISLLETT